MYEIIRRTVAGQEALGPQYQVVRVSKSGLTLRVVFTTDNEGDAERALNDYSR